jgi:signal transduction histidine kinase
MSGYTSNNHTEGIIATQDSEHDVEDALALSIMVACRLAYALTDGSLRVERIGGDLGLFPIDCTSFRCLSLYDLAPELVGSAAELDAVMRRELHRHELNLVNRESPTGDPIYLSLTNLAHVHRDGSVGILHVIQDVTEFGQLEQRLVQHRNELFLLRQQLAQQNNQLLLANAELQMLDDAKSQFISAAAHELRTPLTSLVGFVEMLLEDAKNRATPRQLQFVEMINRSAQRLTSLTNNLLDITRMDANRLELNMQAVDPLTLVERVANEIYPMLAAKGQSLALSAAPKLPRILCDEARAQQILSNLLFNAHKYTDEGGAIRIAVERDDSPAMVRLSVEDNGYGIPASEIPHLFTRFYRASNVRNLGIQGAGLGLAITRSLVELHSGRIWVESVLGKGSKFSVTFSAVEVV